MVDRQINVKMKPANPNVVFKIGNFMNTADIV